MPAKTISVRLPDGTILAGKAGIRAGELLAPYIISSEYPVLAALIDNQLVNLGHKIDHNSTLEPVDTASEEGMRIYQRSLCFVLVVAMHELHPTARLIIDHSVPNGGFFCELRNHPPLSARELADLETRMRAIVAQDEPIRCERLPLEATKQAFRQQGFLDKVSLLEYDSESLVTTYVLRGIRDTFYGPLTASTGVLKWFGLLSSLGGFILFVPQPHKPTELPVMSARDKVTRVFRDYGQWLSILGLEDISSLNKMVDQGSIREIVLVSEAFHEKLISELADSITALEKTRVVLISGPSSSGKTTFARRLSIQLRVNGLKPYALGLDDYFVDRAATPHDENGDLDFEAFEAVDAALFNDQLQQLLRGESVQLRHYNFLTGQGFFGEPVMLPSDAMLIVEGIHGLNPGLLSSDVRAQTFRLYVSALTQLNIDDHNRIPTTDSRLLRRLVRDTLFRGYPPEETLARWASVRRGEERHIFPYQEDADAVFNTALAYELAVLKPYAEPLLEQIPPAACGAREAQRLLALLRWVHPCPAELVPDNSLLREFIGGSILQDFAFALPRAAGSG